MRRRTKNFAGIKQSGWRRECTLTNQSLRIHEYIHFLQKLCRKERTLMQNKRMLDYFYWKKCKKPYTKRANSQFKMCEMLRLTSHRAMHIKRGCDMFPRRYVCNEKYNQKRDILARNCWLRWLHAHKKKTHICISFGKHRSEQIN